VLLRFGSTGFQARSLNGQRRPETIPPKKSATRHQSAQKTRFGVCLQGLRASSDIAPPEVNKTKRLSCKSRVLRGFLVLDVSSRYQIEICFRAGNGHHFRKRLTYTAAASCRSLTLSHGVEPWIEIGGVETKVTAYFPVLTIGDETYDFSHLEPFNFKVSSQLAKRDLRIIVSVRAMRWRNIRPVSQS
jgi:hypothetical protein